MAADPAETKARLVKAALDVLAEEGITNASARRIAARADVNQALIFYHYGSVDGLLVEASRETSRRRAQEYAARLAEVSTFAELARLARVLHAEDREAGTLTVLAQLLAGARTKPDLGPALAGNFALFTTEVRKTFERLLTGTPLDGLLDPGELAQTVSAGFIGLELLDVVTGHDDRGLFDALDNMARLMDTVLEAGLLERSVLRRRLRDPAAKKPRA